ncbi:MAG TPA: CoA pyrophosphatase [Nitrososphaerales archaeon]|nr:CoA pyrophosphatase [Nitrososphaerales archaeon]
MTLTSFLDSLTQRLTGEETARLVPKETAGVAVIFRITENGEEVLLIRRAEREGDPWSGQVAFPGGRVEATDGSFEQTARRETAEEVGIDLSSNGAAFLGYMGSVKTKTKDVVVVPSVFTLAAPAIVTLNNEAASYEWVPLKSLASIDARSTYLLRRKGSEVAFPSLVHNGMVIWGLTERILTDILQREGDGDDRVLEEIGRY